jgi:hypothetical protein
MKHVQIDIVLSVLFYYMIVNNMNQIRDGVHGKINHYILIFWRDDAVVCKIVLFLPIIIRRRGFKVRRSD